MKWTDNDTNCYYACRAYIEMLQPALQGKPTKGQLLHAVQDYYENKEKVETTYDSHRLVEHCVEKTTMFISEMDQKGYDKFCETLLIPSPTTSSLSGLIQEKHFSMVH